MKTDWKYLIAVQINAVEDAATALFFPQSNVIGAALLSDGITDALRIAGVEGECFMDGQELNDAGFVIGTEDLKGALSATKDKLARVHLLNWSQIDWFDQAEEILRTYHPVEGGTLDLNELITSPEAMKAKRYSQALRGTLAKLIRDTGTNS